jgi:hypothetical protein
MKRTTHMHKAAWMVLMVPLVAVVATFQNCSKVDFAATKDPLASVSGEKVSMFADMTVGQAAVPPLKLIFVVDNSYTMQANQISLSTAFGSLFAGNNANNLAPFESTAYIFTTSQASIAPSNSAFGLLPTVSYDQMKSMSAANLLALRGLSSAQVDGKFAGDLVSYSVSTLPDPVTLLSNTTYLPTPVLGINSTGASVVDLGIHKAKAGSVGDLAAAFSDRISYISPLRSKYDANGHGILDPVIDHESGLCALARTLKNNANFLQKGDLAAFVIVSDEDDNDPSGSNCVDAYQDFNNADLVDAHCETPTTKITYNARNAVTPTCSFNYQKGFTYTARYNAPVTTLRFNDAYHKYQNAHSTISYSLGTYTYQNYKYVAHSFTSAPTYSIPQVKVSWYTKSTACKQRDGVQFDCVDSFSAASANTRGTFTGSNCSAFSATVPANAVQGDAAHPVACVQTTALAQTGACSATDPSILNCNQNYAASAPVSLYSDSATAVCSDLVAGKLGAGAIYSGADAAHLPSCDAPVASRSSAVNGFCDGSQPVCTQVYVAASKTVAQSFTGSNCAALITAGALQSNAVTSLTGPNAASCADTPYWDSSATTSACPTILPAGKIACTDSTIPDASSPVASGVPTGAQTCQTFAAASGKLPSYSIAASVTCTAGTTPSSYDTPVVYTATSYPGLMANVGDACPADITSAIQAARGADATCVIKSLNTVAQSYANTCALSAAATAALCSAPANHGCTIPLDNQSSVNQPYQLAFSTHTFNGTFTCDSQCSDAYGACSGATGLVKDTFYNCQAAVDSKIVSPGQTAVLASKKDSLCADPAKVVVDKSYHSTGTMPQYVAGSGSANGDPNALINYIKARSTELLGSELPATSVFVRQQDGGQGGTEGKSYKSFAASMGGVNHDVNAPAAEYASSLQSLGGVIKDKLARSFSIPGFTPDQQVLHVWYQAQGSTAWIEKQQGSEWTASGGTITMAQSFDMHTGDNFRAEYK